MRKLTFVCADVDTCCGAVVESSDVFTCSLSDLVDERSHRQLWVFDNLANPRVQRLFFSTANLMLADWPMLVPNIQCVNLYGTFS